MLQPDYKLRMQWPGPDAVSLEQCKQAESGNVTLWRTVQQQTANRIECLEQPQLKLYVRELQKVGGRRTLREGLPLDEPATESRKELQTQTSVSSPEPSFVMLRKLVEETDSKFVVAHEEVCINSSSSSSSSSFGLN